MRTTLLAALLALAAVTPQPSPKAATSVPLCLATKAVCLAPACRSYPPAVVTPGARTVLLPEVGKAVWVCSVRFITPLPSPSPSPRATPHHWLCVRDPFPDAGDPLPCVPLPTPTPVNAAFVITCHDQRHCQVWRKTPAGYAPVASPAPYPTDH